MKLPPSEASSPAAPCLSDDETLAGCLQRSRVLVDAPDAVLQRAIDLFVARAPEVAAPSLAARLQRLVATLVFDSANASPLDFGLRASAEGGVRQLLFSAQGRDVDLRLLPLDAEFSCWRVSGQVLGPDTSGETELTQSDGARSAVAWTELAEFSFSAVSGSPCWLKLRSADWELELPPIELQAPLR